FGIRSSIFRGLIFLRHFANDALGINWRDFCDGKGFGLRQGFDPLKKCCLVTIWEHKCLVCFDAINDLFWSESLTVIRAFKIRPMKTKRPDCAMTAKFNCEALTFILKIHPV